MTPNKMLTFSFDDGVTQDKRLVALFNQYGMKATFNLNSRCFSLTGVNRKGDLVAPHNKIDADEVAGLYAGHEVAGHTLTHPHLENLDDAAVVDEVEQDRINLSDLSGQDVVGFAYPYGTFNDRVVDLMTQKTGVKYARTTHSTYAFDLPADPMRLDPTVHVMEFDKLFELGEAFLNLRADAPRMFYVWGHAYEFDFRDTWSRFEDFLRLMAGREDIAYVTNREALGV